MPKDFFYAFEGVLKTGYELGTAIEHNPKDVMHGMAMRAILLGDLSPLLMVPTYAKTGFFLRQGYVDLNTWGLGAEEEPHECTTIKAGTGPRRVVISAEEVGIFRYARRFTWVGYILGPSSRMAVDASGLDVDKFVDSIGVRLYGQNRKAIYMRLAQEDRRHQLQNQIRQLYDRHEGPYNGHIIDRVAELIGLSNTSLGDLISPLSFLEHHGNTLHHGKSGALVGIQCTSKRRVQDSPFANLLLTFSSRYEVSGHISPSHTCISGSVDIARCESLPHTGSKVSLLACGRRWNTAIGT